MNRDESNTKVGQGRLISFRLPLLPPGLIFEVTFKATVQMNAFWSLWRDEPDSQPPGWQLLSLSIWGPLLGLEGRRDIPLPSRRLF